MALRSVWNGTIAFGLVKVPVKLYSATSRQAVRFREVDARDGTPLERRRICIAEDVEVPYDEVVKGYEIAPDEFVILERDEIKAAAGDRGKVVELDEFVDTGEIDPLFFDRTYFAGPRDDPEPYALLQQALERCEKAGVGRFSMRGREYLVAARARDGILLVHTLRFHDEVIAGGELGIPADGRGPTKRELEMADRLIGSMEDDFDPHAFTDEYREQVMALIAAKAAGETPKRKARKRDDGDADLAAALEASLGDRKVTS
jgi:DNA end-binding protein Ku